MTRDIIERYAGRNDTAYQQYIAASRVELARKHYLGLPAVAVSRRTCIVIMETHLLGERVVMGIVADAVSQVIQFSPQDIEPAPAFAAVPSSRGLVTSDLGLTIHPLTDELADRFGITRIEGVVVVAVEEQSPAHDRGLKPGDIITSVNDQDTFSPAQFREQLKDASLKDGIRLKLTRKGESRTEVLKAKE